MRIIFVLLLVVVMGCSKETQNNRALDGVWKPVKVELINYTLLKTQVEATGTIEFKRDGKRSVSGTYDFRLFFDFQEAPLNLLETGTYVIGNKNIIQLNSTDGHETFARLVYSTKEDLVIDIPNKNYIGYYLVLKK